MPNTRMCVTVLAGAACVKQTLRGFHEGPRKSCRSRYSTPTINSMDWRNEPGTPFSTSSRIMTRPSASSMRIASASLCRRR
ncbi:hypothetical protein D3C72_2087080 [compost metagenome]